MPTVFGWVHVSLSLSSTSLTSLFRWPRQVFDSYVANPSRLSLASLELRRWVRIPDLDDVVWHVASAFEAVALVSLLCFFYLFCGCTV